VLFDVAVEEAPVLVVVFAAKAALVATTSEARTIRGVRIESSFRTGIGESETRGAQKNAGARAPARERTVASVRYRYLQ
jgi:hypothetical protein